MLVDVAMLEEFKRDADVEEGVLLLDVSDEMLLVVGVEELAADENAAVLPELGRTDAPVLVCCSPTTPIMVWA